MSAGRLRQARTADVLAGARGALGSPRAGGTLDSVVMTDEALSWLQLILTLALGGYGAFVQLQLNEAKRDARTAIDRLAAYKTEVAEKYVSAARFEKTTDKIFEKLDDISRHLPPAR